MSKDKKQDGRKNNRPPKATRWQPGQSGNPSGRPKKRQTTMLEDIQETFMQEMPVEVAGETRSITIRKLILEQVARKAAAGDPKMIRTALQLASMINDSPEFEAYPEDYAILKNVLSLYEKEGK